MGYLTPILPTGNLFWAFVFWDLLGLGAWGAYVRLVGVSSLWSNAVLLLVWPWEARSRKFSHKIL